MNLNLFVELLWSFLLTVITESAVILIVFRQKKYAYFSALCNILTNPALNLILALSVYYLGMRAYYPTLVAGELAVICVEAAVYTYICGLKAVKSVLLSTLLNGASFATGILINAVAR